MRGEFDPVDLADELAEIARATRDPATATRLLDLTQRLLAGAGLEEDDDGGGEMPNGWRADLACATP